MNHPSYPFFEREDALRFDFESVSEHRSIQKRIEFSPMNVPNLYNLAFGDLMPYGIIDDLTRSNNEDRDKILATVVQALLRFLGQYPDCFVFFRGSTAGRTRLYRVIIGRELDNACKLFDIYGIKPGPTTEPFRVNNEYIAFLITSKK